jgi:SLT domain-containing protein
MAKLSVLIGFGAGYVLGARSGRERYEQIAGKARELWSDPRVQEKADQVQQVAKEKAGQAQQVVKDKTSSSSTGPDADTWSDTSSSASGKSTGAGAGSGTGGGRLP